jgi:hypothetical protein
MGQIITTIVLFGGGLIFYLFNTTLFDTTLFNRIGNILLFVGACIPVIGIILGAGCFFAYMVTYQKFGFSYTKPIQVRDSKINRWLFNDIDWNDYDIQKRAKQERERRKLEESIQKTLNEGIEGIDYERIDVIDENRNIKTVKIPKNASGN